MHKALIMFAAAVVLCTTGSDGNAAKMRPGWYAHSLLVYGNDGYERLEAGCLRWHFQQRAWWDHCRARGKAIVTKY